ncbi:ssDNA-binding protein, mitochondrial [Microsporum canis]|uniref:SsDNA binding protein n=1 Tax=Arthroderma otae (strain ATCC MYA-4605 / CBS 113480) TaxID=554155 RepID=C5FJB0_ARTOC|nr:conserved hypothetical protein [Microsporum canis CBS 113480]EEQ29531.1 conserved hypothetical protein [Microsporum canis CBS 113480]
MFRPSTFQPFYSAARPATNSISRSFSSTARRDFARLTVVGRLGAQPELTTSSNGREYIRYSVGTNYGPRDNQQTSWFRVTSFMPEGPGRDHLLGLPKGTLLLVEGDATMRTVEDNEGKKSSNLGFVQRHYDVLSRPYNPNRDDEPK